MARRLYVAAYDVHERKRLARVRRAVNGYASGGQKSAYECWLTAVECEQLHVDVARVLEPSRDSFALLPVETGQEVVMLGNRHGPMDPDFTYLG